MFKIERDVPLVRIEHPAAKYHFDQMKVGDSFVVPCDRENYAKVAHALRVRAWEYQERSGWVFQTRRVKEAEVLVGIRCWRVA